MPGKRVTKAEVVHFLEQNGCKLMSNDYVNSATDIEYRCACGHDRVGIIKNIKYYKQFTCLECIGYVPISKEMVVDFLAQHNCKLLSDYKSSNIKIEIECDCGHSRVSTFKNIKSAKQFSCITCTELKTQHLNQTKCRILNKQRCKLLEQSIIKSLKQRDHFSPENYYKTIQCSKCNIRKNIRLFSHGQGKICKLCKKQKESDKMAKYSKEDHIHEMVYNCGITSKVRYGRGRTIFQDKTNLIDEAFILQLCDKQEDKCCYSGIPFVWKHGDNAKPSIDRIDSELPYSKDNVQMVIKIVNRAKNDLTHNDFLSMVKLIQNPLKETPHTLPTLGKTPLNNLLGDCRRSAKARLNRKTKDPNSGIFELSREIVTGIYKRQQGKCAYTGMVLYTRDVKVNHFQRLSIDRIDSNKGYTEHNVHLVSAYVNRAKNTLSHDEFLDLIDKIHTNLKL